MPRNLRQSSAYWAEYRRTLLYIIKHVKVLRPPLLRPHRNPKISQTKHWNEIPIKNQIPRNSDPTNWLKLRSNQQSMTEHHRKSCWERERESLPSATDYSDSPGVVSHVAKAELPRRKASCRKKGLSHLARQFLQSEKRRGCWRCYNQPGVGRGMGIIKLIN